MQATKVKKPEEIYDYMLEYKIGTNFVSTYEQIAKYYEFEMFNFKKADKIYRMGQKQFENQERDLRNIDSLYQRFTLRMNHRIGDNIGPRFEKIKQGGYEPRLESLAEKI